MTEDVARIVEVGAKQITDREAVAECVISMTPEAVAQLVAGTPKGNPLEAARIAGIDVTGAGEEASCWTSFRRGASSA